MSSSAHAAGSGGDGTTARALPALARGHQETHRGAHRAGVPRAHPRRPQGLHLRGIGATRPAASPRPPPSPPLPLPLPAPRYRDDAPDSVQIEL